MTSCFSSPNGAVIVSVIVLLTASTLKLPLSNDEDAGLKKSAQVIHDAILSLDRGEQISIGKILSFRLLLEHKETV